MVAGFHSPPPIQQAPPLRSRSLLSPLADTNCPERKRLLACVAGVHSAIWYRGCSAWWLPPSGGLSPHDGPDARAAIGIVDFGVRIVPCTVTCSLLGAW